MGFFKTFFGGKEESPEEKKKRDDAHNFDVLKTDGVRALRMGQPAYAVKCFEKALEINDDLETRDYLVQALIPCDRLEEARQQLNILSEAQPDNIHILLLMSRVDYMMEDYNHMAQVCEKATLIDSDNADVMFQYARASQGQGDLVNAVAMFTKTIMLNADLGDAYLERGKLLLSMGDVDGAEEDADHLVSIAPKVEAVLLFKAMVHVARQEMAEAADVYSEAIEVNPFCIEAFKGRGAARMALGDKEGAESDMKQLLELDPDALKGISGEYKNDNR